MANREWMKRDRFSQTYQDGVKKFIETAVQHRIKNDKDPSKIICTCVKCCYVKLLSIEEVTNHLFEHGFNEDYTCWIWHGEEALSRKSRHNIQQDNASNIFKGDRIDDMLVDVADDFEDGDDRYANLIDDSSTPLYADCPNFTRLSATLKLYNLKARYGWTDRSFTDLLELVKDMLLGPNVLPDRTYAAKKVLHSIGMEYEKIHACPNDCILYRKEYESLENCPRCGVPRYKKDKVPGKVLWYFPIIPRLRRLFLIAEVARYLTWHSDGRIKDGKLRHPTDSPQWKKIDSLYPDFGDEDRNLRLALSTDGMCPFGTLSSQHSTWPVMLIIYNLPPWMCMKRKYLMLSLLISGPKQPGNDIDIYLSPLIDDLKLMWNDGIEVYDAFRKENFQLRAMLFCTINDYPAFGNLSGFSTKGYKACPYCGKDTNSLYLSKSQKVVYPNYRVFFPSDHPYRRLCVAFHGSAEHKKAPIPLGSQQVFDMIKNLDACRGKTLILKPSEDGYKKRPIFFELPYWVNLLVRHSLDVMHIEKNVFDSLIGTMLNTAGKKKDGLKARQDYQELNIRPELQPEKRGSRTYLPHACYSLSKNEKMMFLKCLKEVKVPEGYSSNISSLVSLKEGKLVGLKSHDCHILLQQLLPVCIRVILPKHVRTVITRLCLFFKKIWSRVIDPEELSDLQKEIIVTLCQMEMYFPPSFFDIMIHLIVHLVRKVQLSGPAPMRCMYPIERNMKVLKGYVKNTYRPEGCIAERYLMEEAIDFCTNYLPGVEFVGLPKKSGLEEEWRGTSGSNILNISDALWRKAHLYVLHNVDEVESYVSLHKEHIMRSHHRYAKNQQLVNSEHNKTFIEWLRDLVIEKLNSGEVVSEDLKWISQGPKHKVMRYNAMKVRNYTFYTKEHDDKCTQQNSGVSLVAHAMHVSSAKDKNPRYESMSYYGVIEDIWVLIYTDKVQIPVFLCKWDDNTSNGLQVDDSGFIGVDLSRASRTEEPFILATQAKHIFYVADPKDSRWSIVMTTPNKDMFYDPVEVCEEDYNIGSTAPEVRDENETNPYIRDDHDECIWLDEDFRDRRGNSNKSNSRKKRKKT